MRDVVALGGDGKIDETELIIVAEGDECLNLAEMICCGTCDFMYFSNIVLAHLASVQLFSPAWCHYIIKIKLQNAGYLHLPQRLPISLNLGLFTRTQ